MGYGPWDGRGGHGWHFDPQRRAPRVRRRIVLTRISPIRGAPTMTMPPRREGKCFRPMAVIAERKDAFRTMVASDMPVQSMIW